MNKEKINTKISKITKDFLSEKFEKNKKEIRNSRVTAIKAVTLEDTLWYVSKHSLFPSGTSFYLPYSCENESGYDESIFPIMHMIHEKLGRESDARVYTEEELPKFLIVDKKPFPLNYRVYIESFPYVLGKNALRMFKNDIDKRLSNGKNSKNLCHIVITNFNVFESNVSIDSLHREIFDEIAKEYDVIFLLTQKVKFMKLYRQWVDKYFDKDCQKKEEGEIPSYADYEKSVLKQYRYFDPCAVDVVTRYGKYIPTNIH